MRLTGVNFGGYLSQSKDFSAPRLDSFITEEDFKRVKDWGFNCVRLPVDSHFFEEEAFHYNEERLRRIDRYAALCDKLKLHLIFDLHKAAGHSFGADERAHNDLWNVSSENRKRFLAVWDMLSKRYRSYENVILEILNEPVAPEDSYWQSVADETLEIIRGNDRDHFVVIESNMWAHCSEFKTMKKRNDDKIIYSFHFYEPHLFTHQLAEWMIYYKHDIYRKTVAYPGRPENLDGLIEKMEDIDKNEAAVFAKQDRYWDIAALEEFMRPVLEFKEKHRAPVFCGEFGAIAKAPPEYRKNWTADMIKLFNKYDISFAYWNYKNLDFGLYDFTEKYKDNPNYNSERLDMPVLQELQRGIK